MNAPLLAVIIEIVGSAHVSRGSAELAKASRDRLPYGAFLARSNNLPGALPALVVSPADAEALASVVRCLTSAKVPIVARGEGSGVQGGAVPLQENSVILDTCRMNQIVAINEIDRLVSVQAGMNGMAFEAALNAEGWTAGHFPQSIEISTVGGWAACRGAGQASTRYGKIEDMVVGLKAILPDGSQIEVRALPRRSTGPSIRDLILGNEGTLAIITELTLRIWPMPEVEKGVVLVFPSLGAALTAMRRILQAELRPAVVRVYDETESRQRCEGIAETEGHPILTIMEFHGTADLATAEEKAAMCIVAQEGGRQIDNAPWQHWRAHRYVSLSKDWLARGFYMDTIEVTGRWSSLPQMYDRMQAAALAIHPECYFSAHWSHAYVEGACQYMTFRLPPMPEAEGLRLHAELWETIQTLTLDLDGSIAHHHGVGYFRNAWMEREIGTAGMQLMQAIKDAIDPENLFNPGKLGLRGNSSPLDPRIPN